MRILRLVTCEITSLRTTGVWVMSILWSPISGEVRGTWLEKGNKETNLLMHVKSCGDGSHRTCICAHGAFL